MYTTIAMATENAMVNMLKPPAPSPHWIRHLLASTDNTIQSLIDDNVGRRLKSTKYRSFMPGQKRDFTNGYKRGFIDSIIAVRSRKNARGAWHKNASTVYEMGAYEGMVDGEAYARSLYAEILI